MNRRRWNDQDETMKSTTFLSVVARTQRWMVAGPTQRPYDQKHEHQALLEIILEIFFGPVDSRHWTFASDVRCVFCCHDGMSTTTAKHPAVCPMVRHFAASAGKANTSKVRRSSADATAK